MTSSEWEYSKLIVSILALIISVFGFGGTITTLLLAFRQFKRNEEWKRAEFVAKEIKEFESNPIVQNVMQLIDWGERRVNLFQNENIEYEEYEKITREDQWRALLPHRLKEIYPSIHVDKDAIGKKRFTPAETKIRDSYDAFLDYLQRFGNFIEAELVSSKEFRPYLIYWIEAIAYGDSTEDSDWRCALLGYISYYKFYGVVGLFNAYNIDISVEGEIFKGMREKMADKKLYDMLLFMIRK